IACFMMLHVALHAAGSVSSERERQTMDSLLATPLRNRSILCAKWLGSICGPRRSWLFLGGIWAVGLFTGGLHPLAIPCVVMAWLALWPLLAFVLLHLAKVRFRFLTGRPDDGMRAAEPSAEASHSARQETCLSSAPTPGQRIWELILASLAPMRWMKRLTQ